MRKATQEAERPQKQVVQVPWKVKSIRKSRINFKQGVLRDKRNQNSKIYVRPGLEEGPGAKKNFNELQFTHFQIPTSRRS